MMNMNLLAVVTPPYIYKFVLKVYRHRRIFLERSVYQCFERCRRVGRSVWRGIMSWRGCRCWRCWHRRRRKGRDGYSSRLGESGRYRVGDGLIWIEACPHRFGQTGSKIKNIIARPLSILRECRNNGPCHYPVLDSASRDVRRRHMKDEVVEIKRLLGGEVARYGGVNLEIRCSGGCV